MARRRWWVLACGLALLLVGGLWGSGVFGTLISGGLNDPGSESVHAQRLIDDRIGHDDVDLVVLFHNPDVTVDDPAFERAVDSALTHLPAGIAKTVATYWTTRAPALVSTDRHSTYAAITLEDPNTFVALHRYDALRDSLAGTGYTARVGGVNAVTADVTGRVTSDIGKAEQLSLPVVLVLLVIIFGSLAAASLPLAIGGLAILGAFTALRLIGLFASVSVYAANVVTLMGLGLAIDYGLFIVSRFREELARDGDVTEAVGRTLATAGRTVAVSAVTVALSLSGLLLFPATFLRSMGAGGIATVLIAAAAALSVLPALLAVLGRRVDALSVRWALRWLSRRRRGTGPAAPPLAGAAARPGTGTVERLGTGAAGLPETAAAARSGAGAGAGAPADHGFWYRLAHSVMRHPWLFALPVVAVLLVLAAPFLSIRFAGVDARSLPTGSETRQVTETIQRDFPNITTSPVLAVLSLDVPADSTAGQQAVAAFVARAQQLPGATGATLAAGRGQTVQVNIDYPGAVLGGTAKALVHELRALPPEAHTQAVYIGGSTAQNIDLLASLGARLPWMALLIAITTFVLLFLAFGSVVLPLKAIVMNILSMGASFGAITLIFQDGHLSGLLGFTPVGSVDATQPILVLAVLFGLSMDYEVFLLSRMREEYDLTADNTRAVAAGLQRSGRIITSAALLLMVVIAGFSASSVTFIKLIGIAIFIGIFIDASIVRSLLVPATMRLLGNANWWAPRPLRGLYGRFGLRE